MYSFGEGNFNGQNYAAKWTEDTFSSIPEFAGPRTLTVAPNPAEQGAVVDLQEDGTNSTAAQVILRSSDARIVRSEQVVKTDHLRIQLSDIAVGAYLVELRDAQGGLITHGRLIVK